MIITPIGVPLSSTSTLSIAHSPDSFFGSPEKSASKPKLPKLSVLYPDDIEDYITLFIDGCDPRAANTKIGYWADDISITHGWRPIKRKSDVNPYVAATRKNLLSYLERHLDTEHWRARGHKARGHNQPFWLGTLGGAYSASYAYDIDNHKGQTIKYTDKTGTQLIVPDLHVSTLDKLCRLLSFDLQACCLPAPAVLSVSSDSLGLCLWLLPTHDPRQPRDVAWYHATMKQVANDIGLPTMEVYPAPPDIRGPYHGSGRNCHRRPCGQGTVTLTSQGVIEGWLPQLRNFVDPVPLPSICQVADQLIARWDLLHCRWRGPDWKINWPDRAEHFDCRVKEIWDWIGNGCPALDEEAPQKEIVSKVSTLIPIQSHTIKPIVLEEWDCLSHPDRLHKLATEGVPAEGLFNQSILELASQLVRYEKLDNDIVYETLEVWALSRHNNMSSKISEGDIVLSKEAQRVIEKAIAKVRCREVNPGSSSLRVRYLITGCGEVNRYCPGVSPLQSSLPLSSLSLSLHTLSDVPFVHQENSTQPEWVQRLIAEDEKNSLWHDEQLQKIKTIDISIQLPKTIDDTLIKLFRLKTTREGVKRLLMYLRQYDTARIHHTLLSECLGVKKPKRVAAIKTTMSKAGLLEVVSKYKVGKQSTEYALGYAARSLQIQKTM